MNETSSQPPEQKQKDNVKKITVATVFSWIFGIFFLISGLGSILSGGILPGTIFLILAAILLPPVIGPIEKKIKIKLSRGVKAIILIVGLVAVGATIKDEKGVEKGNQEKQAQSAKEIVDQQVVATQQKTQEATSGGNIFVRLNKETGKSEVVAEAPAPSPAPSPQFVSTNFKEYNAQFGIDSKLTDIQKDELFNSKYKGKPIKWRGEVTEVTKNWGSVNIQVKHLQTTFTSDVIISVKKSEENKAIQLNKGDTITYTGILESWGAIMPHSVDEGEIINE